MNINKINLHLNKPDTHIRIVAEWCYSLGTFLAPIDGYLRRNNFNDVISQFVTVEDALETVNELELDLLYEVDEKKGQFVTVAGKGYHLAHGQYSHPVFHIRCFLDFNFSKLKTNEVKL